MNQTITDLAEHQIIVNTTNKHSNKISYKRDRTNKTKQNKTKTKTKRRIQENRNILHPNKYNTSKPRSILNKGPKVYREECMRRVVVRDCVRLQSKWLENNRAVCPVGSTGRKPWSGWNTRLEVGRVRRGEERERRKRKRRDGGGGSGGSGGGGVWGGLKCTTGHRGDATPACGRESRRGP
ncbi:hypothetical protein HZH68_017042 [Vespula germanica]|uniref:Uncharacterized protein n=1 Tax=Vespula germanica TaxID=30212 RepID=A0A834J1Z8_VESGE|nr:hypothetical protein HZH68_017042 [Vespula germanica]